MELKLGDRVIANIPDDEAMALIRIAETPGELQCSLQAQQNWPQDRIAYLQDSYLQERYQEWSTDVTIKLRFTGEMAHKIEFNRDRAHGLSPIRF